MYTSKNPGDFTAQYSFTSQLIIAKLPLKFYYKWSIQWSVPIIIQETTLSLEMLDSNFYEEY